MAVLLENLAVGDVIATRNPKGIGPYFIRLAQALRDRPNTVNHIIVVHHRDPKGVWWGIEGRPGGVGNVALTPRKVTQPFVLSNRGQEKTEEQRFLVAKAVEELLGAPYDWGGIALDGLHAIGVNLWNVQWGSEPPGQVVCSALADWAYERVGLESPAPDRTCTPGDWAQLIYERGWQ